MVIYRVFSKRWISPTPPFKSIIFWTFTHVMDLFWTFNMDYFSFWYSWGILLKKSWKPHPQKKLDFWVRFWCTSCCKFPEFHYIWGTSGFAEFFFVQNYPLALQKPFLQIQRVPPLGCWKNKFLQIKFLSKPCDGIWSHDSKMHSGFAKTVFAVPGGNFARKKILQNQKFLKYRVIKRSCEIVDTSESH